MPSEDDLDFLTDLKDRFWHDLSDLCEKYLKEARDRDKRLEDRAEVVLAESTSIYGRRTGPRRI